MKTPLVLLAALISTTQVHAANFWDGNDLQMMCTSEFPDVRAIMAGYVVGALDATAAHCSPSGVSVQQAADVVCKFLADNPAERHFNGASIASGAFHESGLCQ